MNIERTILVTFFGNYLTNTVVAALVAMLPASANPGIFTPQYIAYVLLAALVVALLTWWYFKGTGTQASLRSGIIFGLAGFVVALLTAFVSGLSGVLTQTGSFSQMLSIIPNFWPFLVSSSTLALLLYWVIPAGLVGWLSGGKSASAAAPSSIGSVTM